MTLPGPGLATLKEGEQSWQVGGSVLVERCWRKRGSPQSTFYNCQRWTFEPRSTTYLWAWVATIFAQVCASEESGLTWNTGYESLPLLIPLSVRMTERKWKQVDLNNGIDEERVKYFLELVS